jgi:beta-1,4-N-acetylglucosaminyltransferase
VYVCFLAVNSPRGKTDLSCSKQVLALPSPSLVYVESLARTRRLSLSAKLVRPIVDRFFVQWESLREELLKGEKGGGRRLTAKVECEGWLM